MLSQSQFLNSLSVLSRNYVVGIPWVSYVFHIVTFMHKIFSFYWAILCFATGFLNNKVPDYSYCLYFAHTLFRIKQHVTVNGETLNIELYLNQRLCWCPCMTIEACDCQITAAYITCPQGKLEREMRVVAVVVFRRMRWHLPRFGSLSSGLLACISSGQEEIQSIYLIDLHVVVCPIHSASVLVSPWLPWVQFVFWC